MSSTGRSDRRAPRHGQGEAGFTLVELLAVLAIMALAAGVLASGGAFRGGGAATLASDARALGGALRAAREEAVLSGRPVGFELDAAARRWRAGSGAAGTLSPEVAAEVTLDSRQAGGGRAVIRFLPDGSSTGGEIRLAAGQRRRTLRIDWLTGNVALSAP